MGFPILCMVLESFCVIRQHVGSWTDNLQGCFLQKPEMVLLRARCTAHDRLLTVPDKA